MARDSEEGPREVDYPLDSKCYIIEDVLDQGLQASLFLATCGPMNSEPVLIKSIDLDACRADFDIAKATLPSLSHPNILRPHCSFMVDRKLWVVMPFMAYGSLKSIVSSFLTEGLSEQCIAILLKEILNALSHLHGKGQFHGGIKPGNILVDTDGSVKLSDLGISASNYEKNSGDAGKPYWTAPEVMKSSNGYSCEADIWSFGITALELAHGGPPISLLPPSKSLIKKMAQRFGVSNLGITKKDRKENASHHFKGMVGLCLDQEPSKRPTAEELLSHLFFKNRHEGSDFLVKNFLPGLFPVRLRFRDVKLEGGEEEDEELTHGGHTTEGGNIVKEWKFNAQSFELDPHLFTAERGEDDIVKQVYSGHQASDEAESGGGEAVSIGGGERVGLDSWMADMDKIMKEVESARAIRADQNLKIIDRIDQLRKESSMVDGETEQLLQGIEDQYVQIENESANQHQELVSNYERLKSRLRDAFSK